MRWRERSTVDVNKLFVLVVFLAVVVALQTPVLLCAYWMPADRIDEVCFWGRNLDE